MVLNNRQFVPPFVKKKAEASGLLIIKQNILLLRH